MITIYSKQCPGVEENKFNVAIIEKIRLKTDTYQTRPVVLIV